MTTTIDALAIGACQHENAARKAAFSFSRAVIIRQLYDFRAGVRAGAGSALMKPVVEKLAMDDMISLAAYVASLSP
jgi:cytochrome c553